MKLWRRIAGLVPAIVFAAGCSDSPTGPEPEPPPDPELSVITPFLLPPGADWGLYFQSFNQTRNLTARVIHYPDGTVTGNGYFAIPLVGSGVLRVTGATPYGNCIPQGSPCGTVTNVPESAVATGTARFLSGPRAGRQVPFTLDLHSTFWPLSNTLDQATLTFCTTTNPCGSYGFVGELHHEPQ
jgi:hypothetical protein